MKLFMDLQRRFWWKGPMLLSLILTLVEIWIYNICSFFSKCICVVVLCGSWRESVTSTYILCWLSRHISFCDIIKLHCGRGMHWSRHPPAEHRRCVWCVKGLHYQGGNRSLPHRTTQRKTLMSPQEISGLTGTLSHVHDFLAFRTYCA